MGTSIIAENTERAFEETTMERKSAQSADSPWKRICNRYGQNA
ncbi:hypothetical protein [Paenibacillus sp. FSL H8-0034]